MAVAAVVSPTPLNYIASFQVNNIYKSEGVQVIPQAN